jgi:hypothetical protein
MRCSRRGRSRASECRCQGRLARYGLTRRSARARRLASTNATASTSLMALPRFWRCARTSPGDNLNRTTLPPTTAVAYITPAYAKVASDTSENLRTHSIDIDGRPQMNRRMPSDNQRSHRKLVGGGIGQPPGAGTERTFGSRDLLGPLGFSAHLPIQVVAGPRFGPELSAHGHSPRTFCTFPREFSSLSRQGATPEEGR